MSRETGAIERPIRIGRVARPHGLKGGMRVTIDQSDSRSLEVASRVFLQNQDLESREYRIEAARRLGDRAIWLKLAGVDSCEAAETLRGAVVSIDETELPAPADNEFYDYRAIGCAVVSRQGDHLGTVTEVFGNGANDVLVVHNGARETLVPVIADIIKELDFAARRITIEVVPGLLD